MVSTEIDIYASQRHLVLRQQSAAQATSEQGKGQRREGVPGPPTPGSPPGRSNRASIPTGQRGSTLPQRLWYSGLQENESPRGGPPPSWFPGKAEHPASSLCSP